MTAQLFLAYGTSTFSLILKGFSIGKEKTVGSNKLLRREVGINENVRQDTVVGWLDIMANVVGWVANG